MQRQLFSDPKFEYCILVCMGSDIEATVVTSVSTDQSGVKQGEYLEHALITLAKQGWELVTATAYPSLVEVGKYIHYLYLKRDLSLPGIATNIVHHSATIMFFAEEGDFPTFVAQQGTCKISLSSTLSDTIIQLKYQGWEIVSITSTQAEHGGSYFYLVVTRTDIG